MTLSALLALVLAGASAGLVSGLVGIGGGVLLVPFLYALYAHPASGVRLPAELATVVAHATSLATIVPTAARGAWVYTRTGLVAWRLALPMGAAAVVTAALAARIAPRMPAAALRVSFGVLLIYTAVQLGRGRLRPRGGSPTAAGVEPTGPAPLLLGLGALVGALSALLGIGGGLIAIPVLIGRLRLDLRRVAATSLAVVGIAASAGATSYMLQRVPGARPAYSVGYVHGAATLAMLPGAALAVGWGARLNQRLPERTLRLIFATVLGTFGVQLLWSNGQALFG